MTKLSLQKRRPLFAFFDESGITKDPKQVHLGVGGLVINKNQLALNKELRDMFLTAINELNAIEEKFEFKFTYITRRSIVYYEQILSIMEKNLDTWHFTYALEPRSKISFWEHYLMLTERVCASWSDKDKYIVLADHLNKPKRSKQGLTRILETVPTVENILQVESQGTMFLQVADILLGGLVFNHSAGKDIYKRKISVIVTEMLKRKEGAGIDPIYATPNNSNDNKSL